MVLEQAITSIMEGIGSSTLVNLVIFISAILVIKYLLKSVFHVILAGASGVIFLFVSNRFLGSSYTVTFENLVFFAAAGGLVYLAATFVKHLLGIFRR